MWANATRGDMLLGALNTMISENCHNHIDNLQAKPSVGGTYR